MTLFSMILNPPLISSAPRSRYAEGLSCWRHRQVGKKPTPGTLGSESAGFSLIPLVLKCLTLVMTLLLISACATNPVTGKSDFVLMSEEQEIQLGKQNHAQVLKQYNVYPHPELQAYLNNLGQKLARKSHRANLQYTFTLLDSPEVNAFALPGGYIYITRGIIAYMNNEEQLAGVLGHELGHVTARHGVRQDRTRKAKLIADIFATLVSAASGHRQVAQITNQAGHAIVSGYGREHELEADRLGAEYLARTGYDPEKMLGVVGILKDQEEFELQRAREEGRKPRVYHGLFASHPRNDRRLQEVVRAAEKFKNPNARQTNSEKFLRLMDNVTFGDSEEQGIVRDHRFYHKTLDFTVRFPDHWQIENQPDQLVAIRQDGKAAMIVSLDKLKDSENASRYLHRKFTNLQNGRKLRGGGYTGISTGKTPFGVKKIRVTSVPLGDSRNSENQDQVFIVTGFGESTRPDQQILTTANSIRRLRTDELKLASAQRIELIRAKQGDTFAKLAKRIDLGKYAVDRLRLLNGMYPDGEPVVGQLVKIVR